MCFKINILNVTLQTVADKAEERNIIQDIVSLPEKYGISIRLQYVEGYQCKEIAEILGKSESAVKMRLKRGKKMLKNERR
ncbi:MAG: RNA polymerase sigma factor [Anaerovoracaceae bacterium]